jgi:hypothetical protein
VAVACEQRKRRHAAVRPAQQAEPLLPVLREQPASRDVEKAM